MPTDWLQFNGDAQHSGNNASETVLSPASVGSLTRAFQVLLPAPADGAPVVLTSVATAGGTRDILFVGTKAGHLFALDAHTGATIWSRQNAAGACKVNGNGGACFTTSSPAIDPARAHVYAYGLDGAVHKYAVADGTETVGGGWPEVVTAKGLDEKGSSPLAVATAADGTTHLYVVHSGYPGDRGDYQGHVTAINLADGSQHPFNAMCSDQSERFVETPGTPDCAHAQAGVWARAAVVYHPPTDSIFLATGNGTFDPANHLWGDSVLALKPDGTGAAGGPLDSYTPASFQQLQNADADLGSTAPAILPAPAGSHVAHIGLQSGKDGLLRLLDLDDLSGLRSPGNTGGSIGTDIPVPQGGGVITAPAVWVNPADGSTWAFVANFAGVAALKVGVDGGGNPALSSPWHISAGGTSPVIANGVLYVAASGSVRAIAATTGTQLWSGAIGGVHWESPVVANGTLYITDESSTVTAFMPAVATPAPALPLTATALITTALVLVGARAARRPAAPPVRAG